MNNIEITVVKNGYLVSLPREPNMVSTINEAYVFETFLSLVEHLRQEFDEGPQNETR